MTINDISRDEVRRTLRDIDREHEEALPAFNDGLTRVFTDETISSDDKADFFLGGFNRRKAFTIAGGGTLLAALLAACGDDGETSAASGGLGKPTKKQDATIARTAASLENLAVTVYQTAIDNASKLGISAAVGSVAKLFQDHHRAHAAAFNAAATASGGKAYTEPNPVALAEFKATIDGLKTETDVLKFARDLETIAAQTYQAVTPSLSTTTLRKSTMAIGGVEARHVALLATVLKETAVPGNFQGTDKAAGPKFFV